MRGTGPNSGRPVLHDNEKENQEKVSRQYDSGQIVKKGCNSILILP